MIYAIRLPSCLVLLVVGLLAACTDDSELSGTEKPRFGRSPAPSFAELSNGFQTSTAQQVKVVSDNRFKLELSGDGETFASAIDLLNTRAAGSANCTTDVPASAERKAALLARLQDAPQQRFFNAFVDKTSLAGASEQHRVAHTWNEPDGGLFTARVGSAPNLLPGSNATVSEASKNVFVFTGGVVMIADRTGQVADHLYMACPNLDTITITLTR